MSPEQMAGRRVDGRTDLYSLGVTLFQLLTGRLPHEGGSMAALMRQIANEPAPDVRTLRPELPEALADVVALALEKRPEVRYADGRADGRRTCAPWPPRCSRRRHRNRGPSTTFEKTVTFARRGTKAQFRVVRACAGRRTTGRQRPMPLPDSDRP